jgi:predicted NUDIX family phosphoesterase
VAGGQNTVPNELVLSVPTAELYAAVGEWRGVRRESPDIWRFLARKSVFRPRPELEQNPAMKQLISYTLFVSDRRVFVMKRLGSQGESRLHGLLSIGVGGHMNPAREIPWPGRRRIADLKALAILNTQREIKEEVCFPGNPPISVLGFLNDDKNAVGRVHLGLVTVVHLPAPILAVRETDKMLGAWVEMSKLSLLGKFESWSSLVLEGIG